MAASPGLEPRLTESESAVLPLDDEAIIAYDAYISQKKILVKYFMQILRVNFIPRPRPDDYPSRLPSRG